MDKVSLLITDWKNKKNTAQLMRQEAAMAGMPRKDLGAMDAYIFIFGEFINDLYKLKE